jgi:hypothetical protein
MVPRVLPGDLRWLQRPEVGFQLAEQAAAQAGDHQVGEPLASVPARVPGVEHQHAVPSGEPDDLGLQAGLVHVRHP